MHWTEKYDRIKGWSSDRIPSSPVVCNSGLKLYNDEATEKLFEILLKLAIENQNTVAACLVPPVKLVFAQQFNCAYNHFRSEFSWFIASHGDCIITEHGTRNFANQFRPLAALHFLFENGTKRANDLNGIRNWSVLDCTIYRGCMPVPLQRPQSSARGFAP